MRRIDCFGGAVVAAISDISQDFKMSPEETDLNDTQRDYLKSNLSIEDVVNIRQVHGNHVVYAQNQAHAIEEADALVTDQVNVAIAVRTADCVPVFLYDDAHNAIGIVHAGWQSTQKKIVQATLDEMNARFGSNPQDVKAYIGPCIRKDSFEVGAEFKEYFPNEYEEINGQGYVDVAQANINQLTQNGVSENNIVDCGEDTYTDTNWFSFRRDGDNAGRMLHIMMLK